MCGHRDTAGRLTVIADQLSDDSQSDELRFLERLLLRESEALAVVAASGDVASTSLAARLSHMGLTAVVASTSVFGTTIIKDVGDAAAAYNSLMGAHATASANVQEVQLYTVEVGSARVDGELEALQSSLATFAENFVSSRGTVVFPSFLPEGAITTEQRISDIQTMLYQMREWLSNNQPEDSPPGYFFARQPRTHRSRVTERDRATATGFRYAPSAGGGGGCEPENIRGRHAYVRRFGSIRKRNLWQ
jgi:hypothetical protein